MDQKLIIVAILAIVGAAVVILAMQPATETPALTACTEEAKICPDGSAVGRTSPNCEFAPCPEAPAEPVEEPKPQPEPEQPKPKEYSGFDDGTVWKSAQVMTKYHKETLVGDFNGDGLDDIMIPMRSEESYLANDSPVKSDWTIWFSTGHSFENPQVLMTEYVPFMSLGDFNGDGFEDLLTNNGSWWITLGTNGPFMKWNHLKEDGLPGLKSSVLSSGDFNDDQKTDLLLFSIQDSTNKPADKFLVSLSTGSNLSDWNVWNPTYPKLGHLNGFLIAPGDFNGDHKEDVFAYSPAPSDTQNDWRVALSTGDSFSDLLSWAKDRPLTNLGSLVDVDFVTKFCDFNGDNKTDLFYFPLIDNGTVTIEGDWQVSLSTGSSFAPLETWFKTETLDMLISGHACGDFDGDNVDELFILNRFNDTSDNGNYPYDFVIFDVKQV